MRLLSWGRGVWGLAGLLVLASAAQAQANWPDRPVRVIVPFPASGATDLVARVVTQRVAADLGQQLVVDNKPGAGGTLGTAEAAKAAPDGYTLLLTTSSTHAISPHLMPKLAYDPRKDFTPVAHVADAPSVLLVTNSLPVKTVGELIAYAKAHPGKLNYASSGNGSLQHVTGAMLEQQGGIKMVHVPYKGTGPALQDLLGGQVDLTFGTAPPFMPHIASGKLRVLAVTGKQRLPSLPDVPTTAEAGYPKVDATSWFAVFAPAGVPKAVVDKLTADIRTVVQNPAFQQKAQEQGATADYQTPAQLGDKVKADLANWAQVVKTSKIEAE